jgi:hypothetical protein
LERVQESRLEVVRVLRFPRLLLHNLLHILALVLAARDVGAADPGGALAVGFVIRIVLRVFRVAMIVLFDSLVRCRLLFLLASYVQGTGWIIITWILCLLAVLLISGLLEIVSVEARLIFLGL